MNECKNLRSGLFSSFLVIQFAKMYEYLVASDKMTVVVWIRVDKVSDNVDNNNNNNDNTLLE